MWQVSTKSSTILYYVFNSFDVHLGVIHILVLPSIWFVGNKRNYYEKALANAHHQQIGEEDDLVLRIPIKKPKDVSCKSMNMHKNTLIDEDIDDTALPSLNIIEFYPKSIYYTLIIFITFI